MHCLMISICDAESEFSDGTTERYHLLNHHKELEQLKNIWAWKTAAIKVTIKYKKTVSNIAITEKKEKQKVWHIPEVFLDKVINFINDPSRWRSFVKNTFVD